MTSKHVIRESEPAASSILISRMTRSSVIIPNVKSRLVTFIRVALVWMHSSSLSNCHVDDPFEGRCGPWS